MGRGKRKKRLFNPLSDDDSSGSSETKKWKQDKLRSKIPAVSLPPPFLAGSSLLTKSSSVASKENIAQLTVVPKRKQSKTAIASSASAATTTNRNKFMQKVINLRHQAAEKAEQRKKAMSLEYIQKLSTTKKAVDSTLCCEVPVKISGAGENSKSAPQSSIMLSLNPQSVKQSSDSSEKSDEIQFPSTQSLHCSLSDKTENLCLCLSTNSPTSDYIHQTPSSKFLATEDRNERDTESDEVSTAISQTVSTSTRTADTTKCSSKNETHISVNYFKY